MLSEISSISRILFGVIFLFFSVKDVYAGNKPDSLKSIKYYGSGLSVQYIDLHNPRQTPVLYSGPGFTIHQTISFSKPSYMHGGNITFTRGLLQAQNGLNLTSMTKISLEYAFHQKLLLPYQKTSVFLGADVNIFLNLRSNPSLGNNSLYYDFMQQLRICGLYRYNFSSKKNQYTIEYGLKIPLFGMVSRPPKAYFIKEDETTDYLPTSENTLTTLLTNGKMVFVGQYSDIESELTIWRTFRRNRNRIGLSYVWNLYTYRDYFDQKQVIGSHAIRFMLLTNL
jgi:hypothetical protein